jgi:chromosomal replication initiation ATPase DnaA
MAGVVVLVATALLVDPLDVAGPSRGSRKVVLARQVAMYLAVVCLEHRQSDVGRVFRRSRCVVRHNVHVIEDRRDDPAFDAWLENLERILEPHRS